MVGSDKNEPALWRVRHATGASQLEDLQVEWAESMSPPSCAKLVVIYVDVPVHLLAFFEPCHTCGS